MSDHIVAIQLEESDGTLIVHLSGEIDLSNADQVHNELESAVKDRARVVVDLAELRYLDSQGLRLIKQLSDRVQRSGGKLELIAPAGTFVRQVFDMARMSHSIQIRDRLEV
jgi:anti-sigma B factor antagonist